MGEGSLGGKVGMETQNNNNYLNMDDEIGHVYEEDAKRIPSGQFG